MSAFNCDGKHNEEFFMEMYAGVLHLEGCEALDIAMPLGMRAFYALNRFDKTAFYTVCFLGISGDAEDFYKMYLMGAEL